MFFPRNLSPFALRNHILSRFAPGPHFPKEFGPISLEKVASLFHPGKDGGSWLSPLLPHRS